MKRSWVALCGLSLALAGQGVNAEERSSVLRMAPSLDALVATDARLEPLFENDSAFEGPTWVRDGGEGYLLFADIPGNVVDRLNSEGKVSVYLDDVFAGKGRYEPLKSFGGNGARQFVMRGANGMTLDLQGRLVYCELSDGQVVRVEKDGHHTVLASQFEGYRFNRTNDLIYKSDGTLIFSDSGRGEKRTDGSEGVPYKGLYALKDGNLRLLSKEIDHPNGMALSPDEKYLYVANSMVKNVLRFDVVGDSIRNQKILIDMSVETADGVPDGIKVDSRGNIYCTGPGGIWIISPSGKHLGTIVAPKHLTNFTFGGKDLKTLYLVGVGVVYRLPMKIAGRPMPRSASRSGD